MPFETITVVATEGVERSLEGAMEAVTFAPLEIVLGLTWTLSSMVASMPPSIVGIDVIMSETESEH